MSLLSRLWRTLRRSHISGLVVAATCIALFFTFRPTLPLEEVWVSAPSSASPLETIEHPIDELFNSSIRLESVPLAGKTWTLEDAARAYRARRGRHPPPYFDSWFAFAHQIGAVVEESFFDQVYEDLEPFWGREPQVLRQMAEEWPYVLTVRNNLALRRTATEAFVWMEWWREMIQAMPLVPDVDLLMSPADEARVLIPFSEMNHYMRAAKDQQVEHFLTPLTDFKDAFPFYPTLSAPIAPDYPEAGLVEFSHNEYWEIVKNACHPDDPVFTEPERVPETSYPPVFSSNYTAGTLEGFVSNFTRAKSICHNPNLRTLHGHLLASCTDSVYTNLLPVFSGGKMTGINNDILIPNPTSWTTMGNYGGSKIKHLWKDKFNKAIWRGSATGGYNDANTWWGFHRHRFISMMNGTFIGLAEKQMNRQTSDDQVILSDDNLDHGSQIFNWAFHISYPNPRLFHLAAQSYSKLGQWMSTVTNGGFTHFFCAPLYLWGEGKQCSYLEPFFELQPEMKPEEIDRYKYLPDVDGMTSSGRFTGFLKSLSAPIKSSLFSEWHDARLIPWQHFIPMSSEYQEWYALLEYFLGYRASGPEETSVPDHDHIGETIGRQGSDWARAALRKDDQVLYFYRVILEYARICADDRVQLGYIADLTPAAEPVEQSILDGTEDLKRRKREPLE